MNIHFSEQNTFESLMNSTIAKIEFGSVHYGTKTDTSDTDYLCVYAPSHTQDMSFIWDHHNLQYKTNNEDYIFITIDNLIRNLIKGDMPSLFEVIHDPEIQKTPLCWLYNRRNWFYTYQTVKSYLGYAKRDLKYSLRDNKRLCHSYRSIHAAKQVLQGKYRNPINEISNTHREYLSYLKEGDISLGDKKALCATWGEECDSLRFKINDMLHKKEITHYMDVEHSREIDMWLCDVKRSEWYSNFKKQNIIDVDKMQPFYQALEDGIKY